LKCRQVLQSTSATICLCGVFLLETRYVFRVLQNFQFMYTNTVIFCDVGKIWRCV